MQTIYEMTKDLPAFKRYCARQSTKPRETWEAKWKRLRKARVSEFKAFCKPKGINSILKDNEFTTGFVADSYGIERARMVKVKGEIVCQIDGDEVELLQRLIAEYDRLIERTIEVAAIINEQNEEEREAA